MVDSSIGGKTAVDLPVAKNMVGAFHHPMMVLADVSALKTLPERALREGWAEAIKHGFALEAPLVDFYEQHAEALLSLDPELTTEAVARNAAVKARIVTADERETSGRRMLLNYGHTIGHGVEAAAGYDAYLHGEAVAIGMTGAARLGMMEGVTSAEIVEHQASLIARFGLPSSYAGVAPEAIIQAMSRDKKTTAGQVSWVFLEEVGRAVTRKGVPVERVAEVVRGVGDVTIGHGNEGGFGAYIAAYADAIAANFRQRVDAQPEDQLKAPVGELLKGLAHIMGRDLDYRTEVRVDDIDGRPDLGVTLDGQLIGLIELKAPGGGARPESFAAGSHNAEQWKRFREFPNLIYTDGAEWSLYQNGDRKSRVSISNDICNGGAQAIASNERGSLQTLLVSFLEWGPTAPATAEGLAVYLAPLARILRDEVLNSLARQDSPLHRLADEWGGLLFPEGDNAQFADAYAQTLTYALLLARFEGAEQLLPAFASEALRRGHGLLAEALRLLETDFVRDELRMPIELLERAIGAVDTPRLSRQGDPWIYFYEHFLGAYDPELRKNRGVFYTPVEVVGAQTRLAAELLRTRFGKPLAFADDGVNVLDPAVGTGAYLISVIDHAADTVRQQYGDGAVTGRVSSLADRLYGFELLVGAYAVTHMRLTQRFHQAGAGEKAPKVYLTDTLESPYRPPEFQRTIMQEEMTMQRGLAQELKRNTRVLVCIGNPAL